jgi:hypothetical protein
LNRLSLRLAKLEQRSDLLAAWRGVPAKRCPDHVLLAFIAEGEGWPPGHVPTEAELRAILAAGEGTRA